MELQSLSTAMQTTHPQDLTKSFAKLDEISDRETASRLEEK